MKREPSSEEIQQAADSAYGAGKKLALKYDMWDEYVDHEHRDYSVTIEYYYETTDHYHTVVYAANEEHAEELALAEMESDLSIPVPWDVVYVDMK